MNESRKYPWRYTVKSDAANAKARRWIKKNSRCSFYFWEQAADKIYFTYSVLLFNRIFIAKDLIEDHNLYKFVNFF